MIGHDEIQQKAAEFDLSTANIQRDYVFSWLISGLFQESPLGETLTLKGGNALRKAYFPHTRFSDDLDFTTESGLQGEQLLQDFNRICRFAEAKTGVEFDLSRNRIADEHMIDGQKKAYKINLYFKDFSGQPAHVSLKVRLDVAEYDRLYLPKQTRNLIHPYSDADACSTEIRCVKLEEALADKMKCLLQRRYCYDLFDLVYGTFIARDIDVDRVELVRVFLQKTIFGSSPIAAKNLLLKLPLELFRGFWQTVICPAPARLSFDAAVQTLVSGIEALFAPFNEGRQMELAFYPAEMRNPILQAGAERKLIRLTYDGVERLVEPYSLAFKRRKDGVAQEYLYVWDRTAGRSSGPGTKTLFNYKVKSLEMMDEVFDPRFPIELSKAGDASKAGFFARGGRGGFLRRAGVSRARSHSAYRLECTQCGRTFARTRRNSRLNPHTDKFGNRCYGRVGVWTT